MFYWVIYDISDDALRQRVASLCKNYGLSRIQKSAFLGELTKNRAEMLSEEVRDIVKDPSDCVFVIPMCEQCFGSREIVGTLDENAIRKKDFLIIGHEQH